MALSGHFRDLFLGKATILVLILMGALVLTGVELNQSG